MLAALPEHSHFRAPLLSVLSRGLSSNAAAPLLHASASYIRGVRRKDYSAHSLLQQRYKSGVKRQKIDPMRWRLLGQFLEAACPPKSGARTVTFRQYTTDDSLFDAYRSSVPQPLSFNSFLRAKQWLRVRRAGRYLGHFDCSRCVLYRKLHYKAVEDLKPEDHQQLRLSEVHRSIAQSQRFFYGLHRQNLQPRQLLVLMDFTSVYLRPKINHSVQSCTVQDCILVLEYLNSEGARIRENLDFLCDCPDTNANDYHFVLHVWLLLFQRKQFNAFFDSIDVWTDGGPHHFKTRFCQWMWHWLSKMRFGNKRISHHFFASYHGHSLADGHAAVIKRVLRSDYNRSELHRISPVLSTIEWGPENAAQFGNLLLKSCRSQVHVFPSIDRDPALKPDPLPLVSIKSQHRFDYENGLCFASERTAGTMRKRFSFFLRPSAVSAQPTAPNH